MDRSSAIRKASRLSSFAKSILRHQNGLSLLELTVVAAIISILAALTAVAVTGTTSTAKTTTLASDLAEVQKSSDRFNGESSSGAYPASAAQNVSETVFARDLNADGTKLDTSISVAPIDWSANGVSGQFDTQYLGKKPKHADECVLVATGAAGTCLSDGTTIADWVIVLDAATKGRVVYLPADSTY